MLLPAPFIQLIDQLKALIIVSLEILRVQWDADCIETIVLDPANVRLGHEILTPVVEELFGVRWSQKIGEDHLNFCLRLADSAKAPKVAFQHKPVADTDPTDLERLTGAVHNLRSSRVNELRMGRRSGHQA